MVVIKFEWFMTREFKQWSTIPAISAKRKSTFHLITLNTIFLTYTGSRAGIKLIGTIAPNWASCWSYILPAVQLHKATHCRFHRERLGPVPPKAGPDGWKPRPDMVQAFSKKWWVESDCTAPNLLLPLRLKGYLILANHFGLNHI